MKFRLLVLSISLVLPLMTSLRAWAYPEFIGYGYTTCLTCHYNGHGNGPINDYGRAVWSAEIAGRLFAGAKTDDELGESSGFLGNPKKLPWWWRPGFNMRDLQMVTSPGGSGSQQKNILMQAEVSTAILFDKKSDLIFVGSYGYAPDPRRTQNSTDKPPNYISREHYVRWHSSKNLWLYAGLLDKVYGIRHVNHTAYSRSMVGVAQNDQSHSLIAHYIQPTWEYTFDGFVGNLSQASDLRQKGFSSLFDYEMGPHWRLGASVISSTNQYVKNNRLAVHSRSGYDDGASILWEIGLIQDTPVSGTVAAASGYYTYGEFMQRITRGYNFFITGQSYKADISGAHADNLKGGAGVLMFPLARVEWRVEFENGRRVFEDTISADTWAFYTQLHLSL